MAAVIETLFGATQMMLVLGIALVLLVAVAGIGGWFYWQRRKKRESRLVSLVALLREPMMFDPVVLARCAGKAWNVDLGDGISEGEDGFVVATGIVNTIVHGERVYLLNAFPAPYVSNVEEVSESITDLRVRCMFAEHQAWFSCDSMGCDGTTSEEEVAEWYRRLAKLMAEFLDDNCLLIYVPETSRAYAICDDVEQALMSDHPLEALDQAAMTPVVPVGENNEEMERATAEARAKWPQFVAAYENQTGNHFIVKAPVSHGEVTEFIWIEVTALEGDQIFGTLSNEPANLGPLKCGSKVCVSMAELSDWLYVDADGNGQGGFTVEIVMNAWRRKK